MSASSRNWVRTHDPQHEAWRENARGLRTDLRHHHSRPGDRDGRKTSLPAVGKAADAATVMAFWGRSYRQCEQPDDRQQPGWPSAFRQRFSWASWLRGWISSAPWPRQFPFLSARFNRVTRFPVISAYNF